MKVLGALLRKEFLQILKDPSSLIIAFILPTILLLIYTYGLNLDSTKVNLGIKNDDSHVELKTLIDSFGQNQYITMKSYNSTHEYSSDLISSHVRGVLVIPSDFSQKLLNNHSSSLLLITDGSEYNQVSYTQAYISQIVSDWFNQSSFNKNPINQLLEVNPRVWYNQNLSGKDMIVPASLAVTMTLIGILLSALVVAREWERGTMEALLGANISPFVFIMSKYIPYFVVGLASLFFSVFIMILFLDVPFRGSFMILFVVSSLFLFACLGIGLLISTILKNQFLASMVSIILGFLPSLLLSGVIFPISSMPLIFEYLTHILPARYYVLFLRSEFLSGTVWQSTVENALGLLILGLIFALLVYKKTPRNLDV